MRALAAVLGITGLVARAGALDLGLGERYRQLCAGHLQPKDWDEEDDGAWESPGPAEWSADPSCPQQLTEDSFRGTCALALEPRGWDTDEDGPYEPPFDLALPTCIFIFVPHIIDSGAEGRMEVLGTVLEAVGKDRDKPFVYLWAEAGAQPDLEQELNIGGLYPKLSLYSPRLSVSSTLQLAFTPKNIQAFLLKAALSRLPVKPAKVDVGKIASPPPWDFGGADEPSCAAEPSYDDIALDGDI
ncbi:hypothetical protein T492DRAFT_1068547 [Pavlovales sp. CCMP2436]|nr:hypothetical protein T492DRAFT_1068547 [Pavlovales sp. CCMP2436]